jgi:hypothetical protein
MPVSWAFFRETARLAAGLGSLGFKDSGDGADGTFYDGTVANYDARSLFTISVRPKNGTFYDGTAALNREKCCVMFFCFRCCGGRAESERISAFLHSRSCDEVKAFHAQPGPAWLPACPKGYSNPSPFYESMWN